MTEKKKKRKSKKKVYTGYLDHFSSYTHTCVYCRNYCQRRMRIFITKVQIVLKGYNCLLVNYYNYKLTIIL